MEILLNVSHLQQCSVNPQPVCMCKKGRLPSHFYHIFVVVPVEHGYWCNSHCSSVSIWAWALKLFFGWFPDVCELVVSQLVKYLDNIRPVSSFRLSEVFVDESNKKIQKCFFNGFAITLKALNNFKSSTALLSLKMFVQKIFGILVS